MQMSMRCGGDFTTNSSVVDQILKSQDVCLSFFKNPTTHGLLIMKVTSRGCFYCLTIIDITLRQKLLLKERGVSPVQIGKNT